MKVNNKYLILIGCLCMILSSNAIAQDLIESTLLGQSSFTRQSTNQIAEKIAISSTDNSAPVSLFTVASQQKRSDHNKYVEDAIYLQLDKQAAQETGNTQTDYFVLEIPVSNVKRFQLELMKVNILSDDFQVTTQDGEVKYTKEDFPGVFYKGIVKGDPNSIVSISLFEDKIQGLISDDNGNYILGKLKDFSDAYILYNDRKLKVSHNFSCDVADDVKIDIDQNVEEKNTSSGNCIDIHLEVDYAMFQSHGNSFGSIVGSVSSLFFQVETLYSLEGIPIQLSQLVVWTIPDPFVSYGNTLDVLKAFRQTRTSFNGNLAHLISTRNLGGGIAYLNVLCNTFYNHGFSANISSAIPIPTYGWSTYVIAHELGHNFGSPHTHDCYWNGNNTAIDGCGYTPQNNTCPGIIPPDGGTIMSYCHTKNVGINFNLGFGQQPGDLMRLRYNNAPCKSICGTSTSYCPTDATVTTSSPGTFQNLEAFNTITASNVIYSYMIADYDAGKHIDLVDGFHAQSGSDFHAYIDGCSGALTTNGNSNDNFRFNPTETISDLKSDEVKLRNYPNPFSGGTTIEYILPQSQNVSLIISDLSGRMISILFEDVTQDAGIHTVQFKADKLSPGVYFCTLVTSNTVKTHKITLIE